MKDIIVGVTSGIACYKVIDLVKELRNVNVIMTERCLNLIDKKEFERASGNKVAVELFEEGKDYKDYLKKNRKIKHISLADKADIIVIAPATANIIGKIANGIADDLLTTTVIASNAPVLFCPSMNCKMWENRIVQENVLKLKREGYYFVEPEYGELACRYKGVGRLANVNKIKNEIMKILDNKLKNRRIIVTAGGTSEEIDAVRVITNKSSGKMGIYIAEEAAKLGASVTLIRGRTSVEPVGKVKDIRVESVDDMFDAIKDNIKDKDVIIHAAAVSDFTVDKKAGKIKSGEKDLTLKLKKTKKIINDIKKLNGKIKLVGFKALYDVSSKELEDSAYSLLKKADCDIVVGNDVSKGVFGSEDNDVLIVDFRKKVKHVKGSKREIAQRILELIK